MSKQYEKHEKLMRPFTPVIVIDDGLEKVIEVWGRKYTFGADGLPISITTQGKELLAAPMRLVGTEDGEPIVWDTDYENNESAVYVQKRAENCVQLMGAKQSNNFVADFAITAEYDGYVKFDMNFMTRGYTVAEALGVQKPPKRNFTVQRLWLEIPIKKEFAPLFHVFPNTNYTLSDGTIIEATPTSGGGFAPQKDAAFPFKALFWLGNEDAGLGWFSETDENWVVEDKNRAMELVYAEDAVILRVHFLDGQPIGWHFAEGDTDDGRCSYPPVDFHFGFHATPVKPFPKNPYVHNGLHLDCFIKIKGEYNAFLSKPIKDGETEIGYDRLKRMGVTTLILHEKWNKAQNWFELSEETAQNLQKIVTECHKRDIKVLTYFGYEFSTLSPEWAELQADVLTKRTCGRNYGGWWRLPFQRDYVVCYNTVMQDKFAEGIRYIMDTYHTDGIYLDGTSRVLDCANTKHGCGYYDKDGNLCPTYPVEAVRTLFKKLYEVVDSRGGMINVHCAACNNYTALSFIHLSWYGENLQGDYLQGKMVEMPLDYFRGEYMGRNIGTPVELIAYENRPLWTFESAVACSIIHGILPRPNDINHPLELMSGIWKIFESFPIAQSTWHPYWQNQNEVEVSDTRAKVSFYAYIDPAGNQKRLLFVANTSVEPAESIYIRLSTAFHSATQLPQREDVAVAENGFHVSLGAFGYGIYYIE